MIFWRKRRCHLPGYKEQWFAWRPVRLNDGRWAFKETIWRYREVYLYEGGTGYLCWAYKAK